MKYEDQREETPFATRDNMLDIRKHITELCFRGFGLKKRKFPNTPKNFAVWSEESRAKWKKTQEDKLARQEEWDRKFVKEETSCFT